MSFKMSLPRFGFDEILFFLLLFLIINPISYDRINSVIISSVAVAWVFFAYFSAPKILTWCMRNKLFLVSAIYPMILFLYSFRTDVTFEKRSFIDCLIILSMLFYLRKKNVTAIRRQCKFILAYLIAISFHSIFVLKDDPTISRRMAGFAKEYGDFLTGGFDTVYGIMFLALVILGISLERKKWKYLLIYILFLLFILMAQYAIAIIFLGFGSLLIFLWKNKACRRMFGICMGGLLCLVLLYPQGIVSALVFVSDLIPDGNLQKYRVLQLSVSIDGFIRYGMVNLGTITGWDNRLDTYRISFDTIMKYPLWGAGNVSRELIGHHSAFLDAIASYGVLLGGIFFFVKVFCLVKVLRLVPDSYKYCYCIIAMMYVALGFFNPLNYAMLSMVVYLAVPYLFIAEDGSYFF